MDEILLVNLKSVKPVRCKIKFKTKHFFVPVNFLLKPKVKVHLPVIEPPKALSVEWFSARTKKFGWVATALEGKNLTLQRINTETGVIYPMKISEVTIRFRFEEENLIWGQVQRSLCRLSEMDGLFIDLKIVKEGDSAHNTTKTGGTP